VNWIWPKKDPFFNCTEIAESLLAELVSAGKRCLPGSGLLGLYHFPRNVDGNISELFRAKTGCGFTNLPKGEVRKK